jgi:hypothetical protein
MTTYGKIGILLAGLTFVLALLKITQNWRAGIFWLLLTALCLTSVRWRGRRG